jgi:hypothetical protein|tara:strand:+ start:461 stop:724 length:264 start_codon:yes stop_codon:yes gene_type:complete
MRLFVYKTLFIIFCFFLLFELTIKLQINNFKADLENIKSQENINSLKSKIRDEIESGLNKDRILSKEDAKMIKKFILKLNKEINEID